MKSTRQAKSFFGCSASRGRLAAKPTGLSEANTLSDEELNAFARAYVDYQRIRLMYVPAFETATDPTQKRHIEEQVDANIKRSLAQGLSPQRYNEIFIQVNSSELLRKKALKQIEEERKKS